MVKKLMLDEKALQQLGFINEPVYLIEYDLHTEKKIDKSLSSERKKELKKHNKIVRKFRNRLIFLLKFNLKATQHLQSCWIIDEKRLEKAIEGLEELKDDMKAKNLSDVDERLRIIPIWMKTEDFEHYEDKKAEFLLNFAMEHIAYMEKAKKAKRVSSGIVWRCKRAFEIIAELSKEISTHKRIKELKDTNQILDELTCQVEAILKKKKAKEA